jgi:hypothetical protein
MKKPEFFFKKELILMKNSIEMISRSLLNIFHMSECESENRPEILTGIQHINREMGHTIHQDGTRITKIGALKVIKCGKDSTLIYDIMGRRFLGLMQDMNHHIDQDFLIVKQVCI